MRTTPYTFAQPIAPVVNTEKPSVTTEVTKKSFAESHVTNLSSLLRRQPAEEKKAEPKTEVKPENEKKAEPVADEKKAPPTPEESSAKLKEDVEKLKGKLEEQLKETIADPKRASKSVLRFVNTVRFLLYPWIYKKIIYANNEANEADEMLKKVAANRIAGKPETDGLNGQEKYLWDKSQFYDKQCRGVLWTPSEIDQINDVAYMKLAEIKFLRWLMENEWALVFIVIESKRIVPVVGYRMGFGELDLSLL